MRSPAQTIVACIALAVLASGCAVMVRDNPDVKIGQLDRRTPKTVAVLSFYNESDQPMAAGAARDAAFYALSERGFRMLPIREIDRKLNDRTVAASLRRANGSLDAQAAGRTFGSDAVVVGRVLRAKPRNVGVVGLNSIKVQVWLIDTRSGEVLWADTASALVRVSDSPHLPRWFGPPKSLTPAERNQAPLLRLCRSFDALFQRMALAVPSVAFEPEATQLSIGRLDIRSPRPVVSAGDRIEILAEGTPGCVARATLGTLGTTVTLEESGGRATGLYRGSYTIQPGDCANYCRVALALESGTSRCRRVADAKSAFMVDAIPPLPPTGLAYETRLTGVVLTWDPSLSPDVCNYLVFRSDATTAGVRALARPSGIIYTDRIEDDRAARMPHHYVYFVKAVDCAGNPSSSSAELVFDLPARGPSTVGGIIQGEARWTAYGGPYRLVLDVDVAPGARLVIEPGALIEIPPGMGITVRGTVEAIGKADEPIRVVGAQASRGFYVAQPNAILRASYVEISGAQRGAAIEAADGECYLDQVTLRDNKTGLDAQGAKRLALSHSTVLRNGYGVVVGSGCEIRACDFIQNEVGLRVLGEGTILDHCLFDNLRLDIEKLGGVRMVADGNTFWTSDPSELSRRLWGNVVCRTIFVRRRFGRGDRPVQFEPVTAYLARGEAAAFDNNWEKALRCYEAALVQERNRDVIEKALKLYKPIVEAQGPQALEREIDFCRSAVLTYSHDVKLLHHLADLYSRRGNSQMAREIFARILRIDPKDEVAKKNLAASVPSP